MFAYHSQVIQGFFLLNYPNVYLKNQGFRRKL
jgi:hypothetical protein